MVDLSNGLVNDAGKFAFVASAAKAVNFRDGAGS
jgi:hypothetical protein